MEKLSMCRICLAKNVPMYVVVNKNLRELYEKLTDVPFVTEDKRPVLVCLFCCAKLKQCVWLLQKCLEAEELFTRMLNEDYEPNSLLSPDFSSRLIRSPIECLSIVNTFQTLSISIKEELPGDCEGLDDIKDNQSDEIEPDNEDNNYLDVQKILPDHSESDSEGSEDIPLKGFKTEAEEAIVESKKKERAVEINSAPATTTIKLEETTTAAPMKNEQSHLKIFRTTRNRTLKPGTCYTEPNDCDQLNLNRVKTLKPRSRTRFGDEPNKCRQKSQLAKLIQINTGEKPYKCDICQHSFSRKGLLIKHIRIHTGEKPYTCKVCHRSFSESGSLTKHIRIHSGEKPYKCNFCRRSFIESGGLKSHIRTHTGEKPYVCDVCQRSFTEAGSLRKHSRIHTGEKPHICEVCQRSFGEKSSLKKHFRVHTGEKPYKCDVCQRSFSQKSELTRHFRIHTGEKPYKCVLCQNSFITKSSLTKHIRKHTGEKPYKCDVCQRSFSQRCSLNNHVCYTGEKP